eukprot:TRINITY_DN24395_c0_g1_i1.p1 TRINITY_DN24395_c0_g1~~TRINITY_DN24395_c0_g1_i1.p1  ORF type:complete len:206 (-),score=59.43 TRINITY_DN24395_c0_g1_i1:21-638(-)
MKASTFSEEEIVKLQDKLDAHIKKSKSAMHNISDDICKLKSFTRILQNQRPELEDIEMKIDNIVAKKKLAEASAIEDKVVNEFGEKGSEEDKLNKSSAKKPNEQRSSNKGSRKKAKESEEDSEELKEKGGKSRKKASKHLGYNTNSSSDPSDEDEYKPQKEFPKKKANARKFVAKGKASEESSSENEEEPSTRGKDYRKQKGLKR